MKTKLSYDQVGTKETIENIRDISREWNKLYPDNPLEIGDISLPGGVDTSDHDGHQNGKIVDVRPIRTDDKHGVSGNDGGSLRYYEKEKYDQKKTKEIITLILKKYPKARIRFNDRKLIDQLPPELQARMKPDKQGVHTHDNHFHIEFDYYK